MDTETEGIRFKSIQEIKKQKLEEFKQKKKLIKKQCYADYDGLSHMECAMMPSCNKCPSYR